jgi:single-strand DNA-binding protein
VAAYGCRVGACGAARKPLASLGLGLTAALRVRSAPAVGAGCRLVSHPTRPERAKEDTMNRWTGTGHLTKDPKFLETDGGTAICTLRIAVKRAGKQGNDGYFDVKCFDGQAHACADYLKAGREVAIEGRLLFDEFQTQDGSYASRVYIVAERVEFLASRNRSTGQANAESSPDQPAAVGGEARGDSAA